MAHHNPVFRLTTAAFASALFSASLLLPAFAADTAASESRIDDQSFAVELSGYGTVTFASYAPAADSQSDAVFRLMDGDTVLCELPGVTEDNVREGQIFSAVAAVSFTDYNEDSKTDILVLTDYTAASPSGGTTREVRLYTQYGSGSDLFFLDDALMSWVKEQDAADTIASVKEAIQSYRDSGHTFQTGGSASETSALSEDAKNQIAFLAANSSLWHWGQEEETGGTWSYTVTDLDQNGRLELIAASLQGTGLFTRSYYYEINEARDGLGQISVPSEDDSEADIMTGSATAWYDAETGSYYYIYSDVLRNGMAESYENIRSLCLSEGTLTERALASMSTIADGDAVTVTYQDADGAELTEEAYLTIAETVYGSLEKKTASFFWISPEEDGTGLTAAELEARLSEAYGGFSLENADASASVQ